MLDFELGELRTAIEQKQKFDSSIQKGLDKAIQLEKGLIEKDPEARQDKALVKKCRIDVENELPVSKFYVPKD